MLVAESTYGQSIPTGHHFQVQWKDRVNVKCQNLVNRKEKVTTFVSDT